MKSTYPVSSELFVAMAIYYITEVKKEPAHMRKLVEELKDYMDRNVIWEAMDTLEDWLIVYGEYGSIGHGRAGRLYYIETHDGGDFRIKALYDKYWDQITGDKNA
jgi:hypothetical protein